jgi:HAD superfamily hydrolase (TIGR01509 family)
LIPIEGSVALLRELSRRGVPLYGLSNMSAPTFAYLRERYDHWGLFGGIVISAEVKLVKPEAAIFAHLCQAHAIEPTQTVFIDDHLPNVEAARRIGFATIHFHDPVQCRRELTALLP